MDFDDRLFTAHFGRAKDVPAEYRVAHCLKPPSWWEFDNEPDFAPTWKTWHSANWREAYLMQLHERFPTPESLRTKLEAVLAEREKAVFFCFEKEKIDCHRGVFAAYVEYLLGVKVKEWPRPEELQPADDTKVAEDLLF